MKTDNNLEELFEAAKRHEKDQQRQQRLSDMIDQWGTSSSGARGGDNVRRKNLWVPLSVAASILLMVSIGLRALLPQAPSDGGALVAEVGSDTAATKEGQLPAESKPNVEKQHPATTRPTRENRLLAEIPAEETTRPNVQSDEADTIPQQEMAETLLAQNDVPETRTATMDETKVYERTSNRLVGKSNRAANNGRSDDTQAPLMAFTSTGTSATYDLAKINF